MPSIVDSTSRALSCRLVHDWRESRERTTGEIGEQMGVHPESLRNWFKQWQIDVGKNAGFNHGLSTSYRRA